jgi:mRNA interferase HigB
VIAKQTLREFWEGHPDAETAIQTWHDVAKGADWTTPNELKAQYGNASILPDSRAVFNIKGNDYRLVVLINYVKQIIYIRFIGSHKDYDAIDATTI